MNKLVWTEDGENFVVRDARGMLRYPTATELHLYVTDKEAREAIACYEGSITPLPQYNAEADMYFWSDPEDLWSAEDVADDVAKLWPGMPVELLLLSSRLMAALNIKDTTN